MAKTIRWLSIAVWVWGQSAFANPGLSPQERGQESTDRLIIRWANPAHAAKPGRLAELAVRAAVPELTDVRTTAKGVEVVRLPHRMPLQTAQAYAKRLAQDSAIAYAEPDRILYPQAIPPNDPYFASDQWSLQSPSNVAAGIDAVTAWQATTGDPALVVAVVDTGILPHTDLAGRYFTRTLTSGATIPYGYDFIGPDYLSSGQAVFDTANDGDGRDPDPTDPGDWVTATEVKSEPFVGCPVANSSWHGTHVAGIIGATANNGIGIAGINWNSMLLPVRVLGKCGGYLSDILDGVRWAAGLSVPNVPDNLHPARIINLSLGAPGACGPAEQETIDAVAAAGSIVVVAAGNGGLDASQFSPAGCTKVITTSAVDRIGGLASYSNFGSNVAISAPGGDTWFTPSEPDGILSTLDSGAENANHDNSYGLYIGTSMAAPHVSGAISLMLSAYHERTGRWLDPTQLLAKLDGAARVFPTGTASDCTTTRCGAGLLDAERAVAAVSTPPVIVIDAPTAAAPGETVRLDATGSYDDGSIAGFSWRTSGGAQSLALQDTTQAITSFVTPTVAEGTALGFDITATDDIGLTSSQAVTVVVSYRAPQLKVPADQHVAIGSHLQLAVTASQPDGGVPTLSASTLPDGASFDDQGNGQGLFTWTPQQLGEYSATFVATNATDPQLTDVEKVNFSVAASVTPSASGSSGSGGGGGGASLFPIAAGLLYYWRRRSCRRRENSKPARKP